MIKKPQKVGLYIHVSPSTKEQLQEIANQHETTMSSVVRDAVRVYLKNKNKEKEKEYE